MPLAPDAAWSSLVLLGPFEIAWVLGVVAIAGFAQTIAGFGFALLSVPVLASIIGVQDAVVVCSILSLVNTSVVAHSSRGRIPWREVGWLLAGCFLGMPVGLAILLWVPAAALTVAVGVTSLALSAAIARGLRLPLREPWGSLLAGTASGVLNTSTGMNGPPIVLHLQQLGIGPAEFRGALSSFFTVSGVASLTAFAGAGVISTRALVATALGLPVLALAHAAGLRVLRRIPAHGFRRLVLVLLVATAIASIVTGSVRLWNELPAAG